MAARSPAAPGQATRAVSCPGRKHRRSTNSAPPVRIDNPQSGLTEDVLNGPVKPSGGPGMATDTKVLERVKVREVASVLRSRDVLDTAVSALLSSGFDRRISISWSAQTHAKD